MVGVCPPANLAAAGIGFCTLLVVDAMYFPLEVNRCLALAASAGTDIAEKLISAENEIVQHCDYGEKIYREGTIYYADNKYNCIHHCQPLHFYGYEEKQQNLQIGEEGGEGKEHRKIDILSGDKVAFSGDKIENKAVDNREKYAGKEINVEACGAPSVFKGFSYEIVKIKEDKGKQSRGVGHKGKSKESPNLTAQNMGRGEGD